MGNGCSLTDARTIGSSGFWFVLEWVSPVPKSTLAAHPDDDTAGAMTEGPTLSQFQEYDASQLNIFASRRARNEEQSAFER